MEKVKPSKKKEAGLDALDAIDQDVDMNSDGGDDENVNTQNRQRSQVDEKMGEDKENNEKLANSQELLEMVMKQGIVVTKKEDGKKVDIGSG